MCAGESNDDYFARFFEEQGPLRALVEHAQDFITVVDRDSIIRYINHPVPGLDLHQVIGSPVLQFVEPEFRQAVGEAVARALETGTADLVESRAVGADGTRAWYENRITPLRDGDEVVGAVFIATDITGQRQSKIALEEERRFMRLCLNVIDAMIVALDTQGRITLLNNAGCRSLGVRAHEVLGQSWIDRFVPKNEREMVRDVFERLVAGEVTPPVESVDNRVLAADGSQRLLRWHNTLLRDDDGAILGTLSYGQDITSHKEAEAALADREALLASVFVAAPVGIGITKDRIVLEANDRLCEMLGIQKTDLIGRSIRILYASDEEFERVGRVKYEEIDQGGVGRVETTWVRGDESTFDVLLSSAPLEETGSKGRVVFTVLDITDLKQGTSRAF